MPRDGKVVRDRLQHAARKPFLERGYDGVTAEQIAASAGVTERTYFRHFSDKREVLFASEGELREVTERAVREVPEGLAPLQTVRVGFHGVVPLLIRNRPISVPRARHCHLPRSWGARAREDDGGDPYAEVDRAFDDLEKLVTSLSDA